MPGHPRHKDLPEQRCGASHFTDEEVADHIHRLFEHRSVFPEDELPQLRLDTEIDQILPGALQHGVLEGQPEIPAAELEMAEGFELHDGPCDAGLRVELQLVFGIAGELAAHLELDDESNFRRNLCPKLELGECAGFE